MADVDIGTLLAKLHADTRQFSQELAQARKAVSDTKNEIKQSSTEAGAAAKKHDDLTASLGKVVTVAYAVHEGMRLAGEAISFVVEQVKDAIAAGIAFEDQFADVKKAVDGNAESYGKLSEDIRKLAQEIPITTKELSGIATAGGQLGVASKDIKEFTMVVAELAKSSTLTAEAGATFFGQFSNITNLKPENLRNLASTIAILDKDGASTASTITDVALRIAGAGQVAGLSQAQILGWSAAIGNAGINAESGGTAFSMFVRQVGEAVSQGGGKLADLANLAGMTADAFKELFKTNANEALERVLEGFRGVKDSGGDLNAVFDALHISGNREIDDLTRLAMAAKSPRDTVEQATKAWADQNAVLRIAEDRFNTTTNHLLILQNVLKGDEAIATSGIGKMIGDLAKSASDAMIADDALYQGIAAHLGPEIEALTKKLDPLVQAFMHSLPEAIQTALDITLKITSGLAEVALAWQVAAKDIVKANEDIKKAREEASKRPDGISVAADAIGAGASALGSAFMDSSQIKNLQWSMSIERQRNQANSAEMRKALDDEHKAQQERAASYDQPISQSMADLQDQAAAANRALDPKVLEEEGAAAAAAAAKIKALTDEMARLQVQSAKTSSEGAAGAKVMKAAMEDFVGTPSKRVAVVDAVQSLVDLLNKDLKPEQAAAQIAKLNAAMEEVYTAGNEELKKLALDRLSTLLIATNTILTVDRPAEKKADEQAAAEAKREANAAKAEAKRLAEEAKREAERAAQQHRDLIAEYSRAVEDGANAIEEGMGKEAAAVNRSLSNAFKVDASGSEGASLGKAVTDLIKAAKKAGVDEAEALGNEIRDAMLKAVSSKSEADRAAAQALVDNLNEEIKARSALNPENFQRAVGQSSNRSNLGTEGGALFDNIEKSAKEGTPEALKAVGDSYEAIRRKILGDQNLTPEQAAAYWNSIFEAVNEAIDQGSDEARQKLKDKLQEINMELPLMEARTAATERVNLAIDKTAEQITDAYEKGEAQIQEARAQMEASIRMRGMRESIKITQEDELKPLTDSLDLARRNLKYFREDQNIEQGRKRADFLEQRDWDRQLSDALLKHKIVDNASVGGQGRLQEAAAQGIRVGPVNDPMLELHRQQVEQKRLHDRKLSDIQEQRAYEDKQRTENRANQEEDANQEKVWAKSVTDFKRDQAHNLQVWEDQTAMIALEWRVGPDGPIQREVRARVDKLNDALVDLEAKEDRNITKLEGRLALLYGTTMPQILDQTADLLAEPADNAERMERAVKNTAGFMREATGLGKGMIPEGFGLPVTIPEPQGVDDGSGEGGRNGRGGKPTKEGTTNHITVHGNVIGLDNASELFGQESDARENNLTAAGVT